MASSSSSSSSSEDSAARRKRKEKKRRKKEKKRRRKEEKKARKRRRADESPEAPPPEPPLMDAHDAREAADFKQAVLGTAPQQDSSDDEGPMPLPEGQQAQQQSADYGKALRPGEGAAIAAYVQKTCACLGEARSASSRRRSGFEAAGYVRPARATRA